MGNLTWDKMELQNFTSRRCRSMSSYTNWKIYTSHKQTDPRFTKQKGFQCDNDGGIQVVSSKKYDFE